VVGPRGDLAQRRDLADPIARAVVGVGRAVTVWVGQAGEQARAVNPAVLRHLAVRGCHRDEVAAGVVAVSGHVPYRPEGFVTNPEAAPYRAHRTRLCVGVDHSE